MGLNEAPQTEDGLAHVAYYHKTKELSFTYNMTKGNWIDISHGGYAEPVIMRIPFIAPLDPDMTMKNFMVHFTRICHEFAEGWRGHV